METVGGEEAAGRFGGSDDRRRGRATVALAKNGKLQQRGRTRTTTAASASTAAAAAAAATADAADNTSEGVARGIEALEAVAAVATSSSSGRSSPGASKQQAEACGGISLRSHHASGHFVQHQRQQQLQLLQQQQQQRRHHAQIVEPSEPPVWRRRSEMRGMAALKNVAGSRRASFNSSPAGIITVPGVSQGGYNGLATRFGTATTTTSPIIVPPPPPSPREPRPSPADLSLRISGDSAAGGDLSSSTEASRSVSSLSTEDYRGGGAATAASRGRPRAPTAGGSSTSADSWPVERSGRARVSAEVMRSAAGLGSGNPRRRATHRPAGTATLVGSALAAADASGAANGANGSGGGVSSGGVSSGRGGLARKAAGARATVADRSRDQDDDDDDDYDYDDYDNASASNSSSTPPAERSPEKRPYSSSTPAPSAEASKKASPRAKGFTAIMFHERFPPAGPVSSGDRRGHANGAWWVEDHFAQPLPSPPPQHQERGQRGRAADNGGCRDDDGHEDYLLGDGKAQDGGGGGGGGGGDGRFVRRASASLSMESGVWAENARLRMERQRLADALASIRENAELAEERSRVLAKQAALRVRKADVQRQQAEEAAREAEARAYSLSATVQVLKSAVDCGGSLEGSLTPREIEAEVTAAYQGILQDMDMERATLQEQLISVQSENSMLRAKAMGPRTPRTHSFSGVMTTPSTTPPKPLDISPNAREMENPRDLSPLPTPRSFGRPKARGMLSAPAAPAGTARERRCSGGRGGRGEPGEGLANGSRWGSGARGKLGEVLGARVRLVRLEGLGSSRGGAALTGDADGGGGASSSSNNNNPLEAPPPPSKTTAKSTQSTPPPSSSSSSSPHSNGADPSAKKSSPPSSSMTSSGSRDCGVLGGWGGAPPALPWPREVVLWYGRVSLVVTPGPSGTAAAAAAAGKVKGVPNVGTATAAVAHWVLLTDAALYVIETCGGGGGRGESTSAVDTAGTEAAATSPPRTAVPGGTTDSLCRLERHRVWSLSLPLETRALPNGDEVAVRSTAVVIRLRLSEEDDEDEEEEEGGDAAGGGWWKGVAAVER